MTRFLKSMFGGAALIAVSLPFAAQAQYYSGPYGGGHMWGNGWHGWFFGPLMLIAVIVATVAVIALLARWLGPGHRHHGAQGARDTSALDILKDRFARGEIDEEEFRARRRILEE